MAAKNNTVRNLTIGATSMLAVAGVLFLKNRKKKILHSNECDQNFVVETVEKSEDDVSDEITGDNAIPWTKINRKSA